MAARSKDLLFVAAGPDQHWVAWVSDGRVAEFHPERPGRKSRIGDIHRGRIVAIDKRLDAAFVEIGCGQPAFLPLRKAHAPPVQGAAVIVEVERDGRGSKAPCVTARPTLKGGRLILAPKRRGVTISDRITEPGERVRLAGLAKAITEPGEGWIVRTAAERADAETLQQEAVRLRSAWRDISAGGRADESPACLYREPAAELRLLRDHGARFDTVVFDSRSAADTAREWCASQRLDVGSRIRFQRQSDWVPSPAEIIEQVDDALEEQVPLPSGGVVTLEPTAALTAVDIDSAGSGGMAGDMGGERALLQTNLEAVDTIARQLRLRNIGGIIVIDFIDLRDAAARRRVIDRLRAAVKSDSAPCWVGGMSRLGLVEMTRRRRGPTLAAMLTEPGGGNAAPRWPRQATASTDGA